MSTVRFLLVPDYSAARRIRRLLAEHGARSGVLVGSWPELLDRARRAYLLPPPDGDFEARFRAALGELPDAFWTASLAVAPVETAQAVAAALTEVLSATDPFGDTSAFKPGSVPPRPRRHLADLLRLAQSLGDHLPNELATIRDLLRAEPSAAGQRLRVLRIEGVPALSRWQEALVDKLNRDAALSAGDTGDDEAALLGIAREALTGSVSGRARSALGVLQSRLYVASDRAAPLDGSVQWLGVRDFLQEAEVAAGMVQRLLAADPGLKAANIGLLLPNHFEYAVAVEDAFRLGGLALSGLPIERWRRDLGREAVFHFLCCRQKPAPAMAIAVCLASPLMPWSAETGGALAQSVMDGDYDLDPLRDADRDARAMLQLLREGDDAPATLVAALRGFGALLAAPEELSAHLAQARLAIEELCGELAGAAEIDWTALRRRVLPKLLTSGEAPDFNREGIAVWRESQEPWRAVRHLVVLGFAQGHYPAALGSDAVFSAGELEALRASLSLPVTTPAIELARRRDRFRRQLAAVSESVTFLVPRRDFAGKAQVPSESLVFMHRLFAGPGEADGLILELDAADERAQARHLAIASPASPTPPRELLAEDLAFKRDLLRVRARENGDLRPESPSSLETLMVSRLAWLLRGLRAEPVAWAPESADPLVMGTLAHAVFERLFSRDGPLPRQDELAARVEALVEEELRRIAPFLRSAQWNVERRHFTAQTIRAAEAWRAALGELNAQILAQEAWLQGTWSGIAVHGQTDLILGLPGERILIVDYKRSKSAKRLEQMQRGYDSQASLYRAMLASGGLKNASDPALETRLRAATAIGVVYYMLNDQVALSDTALPDAARVAGWRFVGDDIAGQALERIAGGVAELREGILRLNRDGDEDFFEKRAGLKPYALEASPLITLFRMPADGESAE